MSKRLMLPYVINSVKVKGQRKHLLVSSSFADGSSHSLLVLASRSGRLLAGRRPHELREERRRHLPSLRRDEPELLRLLRQHIFGTVQPTAGMGSCT